MGKLHSKSFFGQNMGIIINSTSEKEPFFFIRCIKRKPDGIWEKFSKGEGKIVKFSLEEIIMILDVLNGQELNWTIHHSYKEEQTSISFTWEDEETKILWINIANYSKMLNYAQAELLKLLLTHLLREKIEFSTTYKSQKNQITEKHNIASDIIALKDNKDNSPHQEFFNHKDALISKNLIISEKKSKSIKGISNIRGTIIGITKKALLIDFSSGQEYWIPKSSLHGDYMLNKNIEQKFIIDNWILNKNKILL